MFVEHVIVRIGGTKREDVTSYGALMGSECQRGLSIVNGTKWSMGPVNNCFVTRLNCSETLLMKVYE
jgi:hypothetical protein